jgi:hypothetical protein
MTAEVIPGALVRNPAQPDWGLGQVQSAVGTRVTVNFEHMGKMSLNLANVTLELVDEDPRGHLGTARK